MYFSYGLSSRVRKGKANRVEVTWEPNMDFRPIFFFNVITHYLFKHGELNPGPFDSKVSTLQLSFIPAPVTAHFWKLVENPWISRILGRIFQALCKKRISGKCWHFPWQQSGFMFWWYLWYFHSWNSTEYYIYHRAIVSLNIRVTVLCYCLVFLNSWVCSAYMITSDRADFEFFVVGGGVF